MAYENDPQREMALACAANGLSVVWQKGTTYRVGPYTVHTRFYRNKSDSKHCAFNINASTLMADFELWVCGSSECYYLLPIVLVREWYVHADGYVDTHHPNIRIVAVDTSMHLVRYARGEDSLEVKKYFRATLPVP